MVKEKQRTRLLVGLIVLALALIAALVIVHAVRKGREGGAVPAVTPRPSAEVVVREREVEKLVTVEKEITAEILRDGLRDVGLMITDEYYYTEVVSYSSTKKLWKFDLPLTESSYLIGYDGVVSAGVDFTKAGVRKDEGAKRITVALPKAEIRYNDIDMESFTLYGEKQGVGNRVSVADFNESLVELKRNAEEKAVERGVLTRADENAQRIVRNFVGSLIDLEEYTLVFEETKP